jgi:hypothetical protein
MRLQLDKKLVVSGAAPHRNVNAKGSRSNWENEQESRRIWGPFLIRYVFGFFTRAVSTASQRGAFLARFSSSACFPKIGGFTGWNHGCGSESKHLTNLATSGTKSGQS